MIHKVILTHLLFPRLEKSTPCQIKIAHRQPLSEWLPECESPDSDLHAGDQRIPIWGNRPHQGEEKIRAPGGLRSGSTRHTDHAHSSLVGAFPTAERW